MNSLALMSDLNFPDSVQDAPPTTRLVYLSLDRADCALTARELSRRTSSSKRSVQESICRLQDKDLVAESPNISDGRSPRYHLVR